MAKFARQLDGRFVGLEAGVAEKHIGHARQLNQLGRQPLGVGHMKVIAGVNDLVQLVLQGGHQLGVVVAQRVHGNAGQRIQIFFAIDVPDSAALTVSQRNRQAPIGVHGVWRGGFNESGHADGLLKKKQAPTGPLKSDFRGNWSLFSH